MVPRCHVSSGRTFCETTISTAVSEPCRAGPVARCNSDPHSELFLQAAGAHPDLPLLKGLFIAEQRIEFKCDLSPYRYQI